MPIYRYFIEFFLCFGAVAAFTVLINSPKSTALASSFIGAVAYVIYRIVFVNSKREILSYFVAAIAVAVASEICARIYKKPSTIFIFPGIIPLVPGLGLYNSMLALVQNDYNTFTLKATNTLFIAGAIAIAVAIVHVASRSVFPRKSGLVPFHKLEEIQKNIRDDIEKS
ncbi:MAG: threonine/serine exporter family protein [Clostridia bacterium]|nr:threonine/serine exporter family protein [Clostridia bacterium]